VKRAIAFLDFLRDFFIGDDPAIALTVGGAIGVTAALRGSGVADWWLLPLCALLILGVSVLRAGR
jgi:hypothetical protein